jgi:hypothetical protein
VPARSTPSACDRVFVDFDTDARKSYEDRAQQATGIVEHRD